MTFYFAQRPGMGLARFTADGATNLVFSTPFSAPGDNGVGLDAVSIAGVPEPATWAIMLLGFGGLGAMLRRRRGRRVPLAA